MKNIERKFIVFFTIALTNSFAGCSCTKAGFNGNAASKVAKRAATIEAGANRIDISSNFVPLLDKRDQFIWTVTSAGVATRLSITGDNVTTKKVWTGVSGSGGTRTYVTEGGFVAARYPYVYFIDPEKTPEGALVESDRRNMGATNRICLTSYLKAGHKFILGAWGAGNYFEIPLEDQKPYRPQWNKVINGQLPGKKSWGYSCYIDQKKRIFYSQYAQLGAIALETLTEVDPATTAPNSQFVSQNIATLTKNVVKASYSLAGDNAGNVFNGVSVYTMSYEPVTDSVWVSLNPQIGVFPRDCFTSTATCSGFAWYPSPGGAAIGPLSALSDGRIVGLTRGSAGDVYLLSLKDPKNRTAGINSVKVSTLTGDPYMYTDFTGATLYTSDFENSNKFSDIPGFLPEKNVLGVGLIWTAKTATVNPDWNNIKIEARCFSDAASKPAYEETKMVGAPDGLIPISAVSCANAKVSDLDLKLTQLNSNSPLGDVVGFKISVQQ